MRRLLSAAAAVVIVIGGPRPVAAALEVAMSLSPTESRVGESVEVLLRTFLPIGRSDIHLPVPSIAYPVASGVWDILYPVDYPFDVVAVVDGGEQLPVSLKRDSADGSLWRGTFRPTTTGTWTVIARNWEANHPGASATVRVLPGGVVPPAQSDTVPTAAIVAAVAAVIAFLGGLAIGRSRRGPPNTTSSPTG